MKELSVKEMKNIIGGIYLPPMSICFVRCNDGGVKEINCGSNSMCVASPDSQTVTCNLFSGESYDFCPCEGIQ